MNMIKSLVKKTLASMGYAIVPNVSWMEDLPVNSLEWLKKYELNLGIDIGAEKGSFGIWIREYFPDMKLIHFEPVPASYEILNDRYKGDKNTTSYNYGLGNENGEIEFHVNEFLACSSALAINDLQRDSFPNASETKKVKVQIKRLDDVLSDSALEGKNFMINLDVQGMETKVMEGGSNVFKKAKVVLIEVSFAPCYEGQPLFGELYDMLIGFGFTLAGIEKVARINGGQFIQGDAYFVR